MDILKVIAAIFLFATPFIALAGICGSIHHCEPLDDEDYDLTEPEDAA